jgi:hypothetical protein
MPIARRQHYVPRCYLKNFSVPRKAKRQIQVFDRKDGRTFPSAIDNIAVERDFHTVNVEGIEPDVFEKSMAEFESDLGPALERIIETRSLDNAEDTGLLLNFVTLLAVRIPHLRETIRDFHERVATTAMKLALATPERWARQMEKARAAGAISSDRGVSYEEMKHFVESGNYTMSLRTERHIQLEAGSFEKVLPFMFRRKWILLKTAKDSGGFITSDHPVCLTYTGPRSEGFAARPGFGLRNTEVLFPISPGLAVVGAFEVQDGEAKIDEEMTAQFNGTIASFAERHVYARDYNFKYALSPAAARKASRLASDPLWRQSATD